MSQAIFLEQSCEPPFQLMFFRSAFIRDCLHSNICTRLSQTIDVNGHRGYFNSTVCVNYITLIS